MPVTGGPIYATNDGYCGTALGTWLATRNNAGSAFVFDSNNQADSDAVSMTYNSGRGTWGLRRAFFEFDTSSITEPVHSATLGFYGAGNNDRYVIVVKSEQGGTLAAGDFNSFHASVLLKFANSDGNGSGSMQSISPDFSYTTGSLWALNEYNYLPLKALGLVDLQALDTFKICLMNYDCDFLDQDLTSSQTVGLRWSERGGTTQDPRLDYQLQDNGVFFGTNF